MPNLFEAARTNPSFNRLEIGGFLFAEYTCGVTDKFITNWSETDYFVHILTGRKSWHTTDGIWRAAPGDTIFFKKGANIVEQHFEDHVCLLMLFIPDALLRATIREIVSALDLQPNHSTPGRTTIRVENEVTLTAFFDSMRTYLLGNARPPEPLVQLKLKELVMSVLTSRANAELAAYFQRLGTSDAPLLAEIMEANFRYNLSLEAYAKLCHRSLSSFKREFQAQFAESPGKWLLQRRLDHAARRLQDAQLNVTEVALESGFEDVSHFSRVFKERFGVPPLAFREKAPAAS